MGGGPLTHPPPRLQFCTNSTVILKWHKNSLKSKNFESNQIMGQSYWNQHEKYNFKSLETLILKTNRFLVFQNKININKDTYKDTSVKLPIFFFKRCTTIFQRIMYTKPWLGFWTALRLSMRFGSMKTKITNF